MTLVVVVLAALGAGPQPISVAAPVLTVVQVEPQLATVYTTSLAQQLTFRGVKVITGPDMVQLLGFERQQQLMGCADDRCKSSVASALGVDALMSGQVARFEKTFRLDVRLLEPATGRVLAAASAAAEDGDRLVANFATVAEQLAQQLSTTLGRPLVPSGDAQVITRWSTVKKAGFIPLALGVAAAAAGAVSFGLSRGQYDALQRASAGAPLTPDETSRLVVAGKTQQTLGVVGASVGAGLIAAAGALFLFGGDETISVGVAVSPVGASLGLAGAF